MSETFKYIGKTVFYLKEAEDGFCYLSLLDVHAVSDTHLYDKEFSKCVAVEDIFENYTDAQEYMKAIGVELYVSARKFGFKRVHAAGTDLRKEKTA